MHRAVGKKFIEKSVGSMTHGKRFCLLGNFRFKKPTSLEEKQEREQEQEEQIEIELVETYTT
jgi:hypothetical protein